MDKDKIKKQALVQSVLFGVGAFILSIIFISVSGRDISLVPPLFLSLILGITTYLTVKAKRK